MSPDDSFPLVLLVEDDPRDSAAMEALLGRHGFRVVAARTYEAAKRYIDGTRFAAIVADYRLGPGYDGFDLLKYAKETQPLAARCVVTADPIGAVLAESIDGVWVSKSEDSALTLPAQLKREIKRLRQP